MSAQGPAQWRASAYELVDQTIRPAAHATWERYDPMTEYYRVRLHTNRLAPHEKLMNLARTVRQTLTIDDPLTPPNERVEEMLEWCRSYGLLGLWPHQVRAIVAPPPADSGVPMAHMANRMTTSRIGPVWQQRYEFRGGMGSARADPLAVLNPIDRGDYVQPLAAFQGRYFRPGEEDLRHTPASQEFWTVYGEGLAEFVNAAVALHDAAQAVESGNAEPLNTLLEPVSMHLVARKGAPAELASFSPSLLGWLARMALDDALEGRRLKACLCGKVWTTAAYQALYCSEKCRYRYQKRAWRASRPTRPPDQTIKAGSSLRPSA